MNLILLQNLGVGRGMKCYQVFSRTCCSKELSAIKSSLSQGPLPLKKVLWNIWISGGCMGQTPPASQKCCVEFLSSTGNWEGKTVTRMWQLEWYLWVFWSIKLSFVNTISGFFKREMSFIDPVPKAMFSCNYGLYSLVLCLHRQKVSVNSISRFSENSCYGSQLTLPVLCAKNEPFGSVNQRAMKLACAC